MGQVPMVNMPPGRKFQAVWAALHLGAVALAVYVAIADIWRSRGLAPRAAGLTLLSAAAGLHLASAVYHGQRAI